MSLREQIDKRELSLKTFKRTVDLHVHLQMFVIWHTSFHYIYF